MQAHSVFKPKISQKTARNFPKNIFLSGGGVNAIGHLGAITSLMRRDFFCHMERVCGVSAGAFIGVALAARASINELLEFCYKMDFKKFLHPHSILHFNPYLALAGAAYRFFPRKGLFSSDHIQLEVNAFLEKKFGIRNATFADFKKLNCADFYVITANISKGGIMEIFSVENSPNESVAAVVAASMAVPGLFEPVELKKDPRTGKGEFFCDGGMLDNFFIEIFDKVKYVKNPGEYAETDADKPIHNPHTLGFLLAKTNEIRHIKGDSFVGTDKPLELKEYFETAIETVIFHQKFEVLRRNKEHRIIFIDVLDNHPLNFWGENPLMKKIFWSGWKSGEQHVPEMKETIRAKL